MSSYKTNLQKFVDTATSKLKLNFKEKTDEDLQLVPSKNKRAEILTKAHKGNVHFGQRATVEQLKASYWWSRMYREAIEHVERCQAC
ncbi:hypothetical protein DSO57_1022053 [Entomophthora muscae]|uniref:Uncharacterized protein n=1 Tax=Entomophthora muscae TaxID=34485 RepID=A0ACC2S5D9_9FUNG|nr:hypothetical protein DSO57_1022053 [Entomophthora muscae]